MRAELGMEIDVPPCLQSSVTAEDWRRALSIVVPAVVVLRITAPRAFDTEVSGASHATGFVVDKSRGIILTNRHVVKPGPVVAEAMFVNREEIPVYPVYRDPVHDFGFFHYDPGAIKFLSYEEIPLEPEAACVGLEIRVVGNDSGEKGLEHGEFVRVRTVHLNGKPRVLTLKQDLHYWPTWELKFDPNTAIWCRRTIKSFNFAT